VGEEQKTKKRKRRKKKGGGGENCFNKPRGNDGKNIPWRGQLKNGWSLENATEKRQKKKKKGKLAVEKKLNTTLEEEERDRAYHQLFRKTKQVKKKRPQREGKAFGPTVPEPDNVF